MAVKTILFNLLPLLAQTFATPSANTPLKPWEISTLSTFTPSGRAGNAPYSSLFLTITDPNTISFGTTRYGDATFPPSTTNCTIRWNAYTEEPYGWIIPCTTEYLNQGRWTIEIQKYNTTEYGPSPTRDFRLRFVLEESMLLTDGILSKTFVGERAFALGDDLAIVCGGSGVCNTWLKDERRPASVQQELLRTDCVMGSCQAP
ncbi:hypothetical protein OQA88_11592 [Cercophora sp. LCS_1]